MSNSGKTSLWEHVNSCLTGSWRRVGWFFKWAEGGDIGGSSQRSGLGGLLTPSLRRGSWFVAFWNLIAHNCRIRTSIRLFWAPYSLTEATSVCKCKRSRRGFQVPTYLSPLAGKFPASPRAELDLGCWASRSNPGGQTSHSWKLGRKLAGGAEALTQMGGQDCTISKKASGSRPSWGCQVADGSVCWACGLGEHLWVPPSQCWLGAQPLEAAGQPLPLVVSLQLSLCWESLLSFSLALFSRSVVWSLATP